MRRVQMTDRTWQIARASAEHAEKGIQRDHIATLQQRLFGDAPCGGKVPGTGRGHRVAQGIGSLHV